MNRMGLLQSPQTPIIPCLPLKPQFTNREQIYDTLWSLIVTTFTMYVMRGNTQAQACGKNGGAAWGPALTAAKATVTHLVCKPRAWTHSLR